MLYIWLKKIPRSETDSIISNHHDVCIYCEYRIDVSRKTNRSTSTNITCYDSFIWKYRRNHLIIQKGDDVLDLNAILKELEKEKVLRASLFQITHEIKNPIAVCKGYLDMMDLATIKKRWNTSQSSKMKLTERSF